MTIKTPTSGSEIATAYDSGQSDTNKNKVPTTFLCKESNEVHLATSIPTTNYYGESIEAKTGPKYSVSGGSQVAVHSNRNASNNQKNSVPVKIYLKNINQRMPESLSDFDVKLWQEFAEKILPTVTKFKKSILILIVLTTLTWAAVFIFSRSAMASLWFGAIVFSLRTIRRVKVFRTEVDGVCNEFIPKFHSEGYTLDYIRHKNMITLTHSLPTAGN